MDSLRLIILTIWISHGSSVEYSEGCSSLQYLQFGSTDIIECSFSKGYYGILWYNSTDIEFQDPILELVGSVKSGEGYNSREYDIYPNGSLIIRNVSSIHDQNFTVVKFNSLNEKPLQVAITVVTIAHPVPAHPVVEGCEKQQFCVLNVSPEGNLTCSVSGIRPEVSLMWTVGEKDTLDVISFGSNDLKVNRQGEMFSITLTSHYRVLHSFQEKVTVKCQISGSQIDAFKETTTVELLISPAHSLMPTHWKILIGFAIGLPCAAIIALIVFKVVRRLSSRTKGPFHENEAQEIKKKYQKIPLLQGNISTDNFISQLKKRYGDMYNAVYPVPDKREKFYPVNKLFVARGVEILGFSDRAEKTAWNIRTSFRDILKDEKTRSVKYIIEGEAGYGKSTLALQLVHDWCNNVLNHADVLIFLQLRALTETSSIFDAIKTFALPSGTKFSASDIKRILTKGVSSVAIVLDGFDEYPHKDSDMDTDVMKIIRRDILNHCTLILTTRPGYLPAEYLNQAKQIRLTGFDRKAQEEYIQKIVGDDIKAENNTLRRIMAHRVLSNLWSNPMIFASLANICHEELQQMTCITTVVSYLILWLNSHTKNKMKDNEVRHCEEFEKCHKFLDKAAFDAMLSSEEIVWSKEELCEQLGKPFYNYYIRTGIIFEKHHSSNIAPSLGSDRTEVKFLDNIFCEWYAAHYLVHELKQQAKQNVKQQEGKEGNKQDQYKQNQVEPFRLIDTGDGKEKILILPKFQQVYRFACGLSDDAAITLIRHLKDKNAARTFVRLCDFEKEKVSEHFENVVRGICQSTVSFRKEDSILEQNSRAQILDLAASFEIPISCVKLVESYKLVNCSAGYILLDPCVRLSSSLNINTLWLDDHRLELKSEDFKKLLTFSGSLLTLKILKFSSCLLPQSFEDTAVCTVLKEKGLTVSWDPRYTCSWYYLNFASGKWERAGTPVDYQSVLSTWRRENLADERDVRNAQI